MTTIDKAAKLLDIFTNVPFANRNLIVDGNKDQWSSASASALATAAAYTNAVMYRAQCGTGGVGTYGQQALTLGTAGLAKPYKYYGQTVISTGSTGTLAALTGPQVSQRLESVTTGEGGSLTLSLLLWAAAPVNVTQVFATQNFGTGGSPSASVNTLLAVNWSVTTVPTRFSVRLDVPSISGKTLGTAGDFLEVGVCFPVGSTYTINDAQWQLEYSSPQASSSITGNGGAPTAFEYRGQQAEAARVQRYWELLTGFIFGTGAVNAATTVYVAIPHATKRAVPSYTPSAAGTFGVFSAPTGTVTPSGVAAASAGVNSGFLVVTTSGMTVGQAAWLSNPSSASVAVDARL